MSSNGSGVQYVIPRNMSGFALPPESPNAGRITRYMTRAYEGRSIPGAAPSTVNGMDQLEPTEVPAGKEHMRFSALTRDWTYVPGDPWTDEELFI